MANTTFTNLKESVDKAKGAMNMKTGIDVKAPGHDMARDKRLESYRMMTGFLAMRKGV